MPRRDCDHCTDPAGHAFGPSSVVVVHQGALSTTFSGYGQGADLDGDGTITASEGVGPTDHKTLDAGGHVIADTPSRYATTGLRDGLIQTTVNIMAMVRMIERGVDLPATDSHTATPRPRLLRPKLRRDLRHDVDGDRHPPDGRRPERWRRPIVEIARLSSFRNLLADTLRVARPTLVNGGPGLDGLRSRCPCGSIHPSPIHTRVRLRSRVTLTMRIGRAARRSSGFCAIAAAATAGGRAPEACDLSVRLWRRHSPQPDCWRNVSRGSALRPGQLLPKRQDTDCRERSSRISPRPRLFGRDQGQAQVLAFISSGVPMSSTQTVLVRSGRCRSRTHATSTAPITHSRRLECRTRPQPASAEPPGPVQD